MPRPPARPAERREHRMDPRPTRRDVLLAAAAAPLAAAAGPGSELPPQPFDAAPLRPVAVPAWVEETVGVGYTLSVMDARARAEAARHGVTISEVGFVDPLYAYYDSKL